MEDPTRMQAYRVVTMVVLFVESAEEARHRIPQQAVGDDATSTEYSRLGLSHSNPAVVQQ